MKDRSEEQSLPVSTSTVLLVEDHEPTAAALARILRKEGYTPLVFHCGKDVLEYLHEYRPAAAVVDIHLPDISGLVLSAKLRATMGNGPPIIILSGDGSMENLRSLRHVGASYFLSKPVRSEILLERLRESVQATVTEGSPASPE